HFAERPERDPLAVSRGPPVVPPHEFDEAVDVLEELPGETALADACRADDRHQPGTLLTAGRVEQILQEPQLRVPAHERRLERLASVAATDLRHHPERPPGRDGACLSLEDLLACFLEGDRPG